MALLTTVSVTLGAAALALLSPLQDRLEREAEESLQASVLTARDSFGDALRRAKGTPEQRGDNLRIVDLGFDLFERTGARVIVTDQATHLPPYQFDTSPGVRDDSRDILRVLGGLEPDDTVTSTSGAGETKVATLLTLGSGRADDWVLAVRDPAEDVTATVDEVRAAFISAALIGLAVAVVLGLALIGTLTSRLKRLRTAALRIADEGPGARAPHDDRRDEVGDLARAFATMQDALDRQERARRAFVATASHELRTPLTSLAGSLELLEEDLGDETVDREDALHQVTLARGEVTRLTRLASDLLDLSRLDAETPLRAEPTELAEIVRAVAAEFERAAADRDVHLRVVAPPAPCWARADPGAVARTIRILIDNALRFAPAGSQLVLLPAYHGEFATVEVIDAGPGVPLEDREMIFERFQRGRHDGGEGGFGLGLAIGREPAERQGGRLELLDDPPAGGARFRLTLPLELPGGDPSAQAAARQ